MTGYGQFCAIARAHEVLGGRWSLLIVREILCGSRRFNDIRRGIPAHLAHHAVGAAAGTVAAGAIDAQPRYAWAGI